MKRVDRSNRNKNGINEIVHSKEWETANIKGITDIVKNEFIKNGLEVNDELISEQVKKYMELSRPLTKKTLNDINSVRKERKELERNIIHQEQEIKKDFRYSDDYSQNEVVLSIKQAYATAEAIDKVNQELGLNIHTEAKEDISHIANELREKVNSLLETCNMAMSKPDLSVDDMYELVFKDIFTKDEYQKIKKEAYEEMVKLGHYRNDDSNKNH